MDDLFAEWPDDEPSDLSSSLASEIDDERRARALQRARAAVPAPRPPPPRRDDTAGLALVAALAGSAGALIPAGGWATLLVLSVFS